MLRTIGLLSLAVLALHASAARAEVIRTPSPYPVKETIDRLEGLARERGLTVFGRVDHAAGAKRVGQELRPTELLIFGNPVTGTPLMQAEQTMGLSLPLKALAWQDVDGQVWLGYDAPAAVAAERGVTRDHPLIGKIAEALKALSDAAVKR